MIRFLPLRLAIIPPILLLSNFFGYTFALIVAQSRPLPDSSSDGAIGIPSLLGMYGAYLRQAMRGDFGALPYASSSEDVGDIIARSAIASLGLLGLALFLSVLVGLLLGISAVRIDPPGVAPWQTFFSTLALAMPGFYLGSLLIAGTIAYIIWGPGATNRPPLPIQGFGWDSHLVLPALVLMVQPTAKIAQVTSGLLSGELTKQYVVGARSVGHSWKAIVRRYALRNILAAVIGAIAGALRLLVGELIIVERLFDWPGIGQLASQTLVPSPIAQVRNAALFLSPPLIAGWITVFAALFLLADLLAAIAARAVDPRLRAP